MKIHQKFRISFITVIIISLVFAGSVAAKSPNKVEICHNNGNGSYELVKIKVNTLDAHLAHGDAVPGSAVPGQSGVTFSAKCALVTTVQNPPEQTISVPATTNHGKKADKVDVCHRRGNETFILINISRNALPAHLAHGDEVPGATVPGQPHSRFNADCTITEIPQKERVQTLSVSSLTETAVPSMVLENGQRYELKAFGTYTYDENLDWADPEWFAVGVNVFKGEDIPTNPLNVLDLTINGCSNNTDWGAYQTSHEYVKEWMGAGAQLTFTICDTYYPDNVGGLTVEIWKINW